MGHGHCSEMQVSSTVLTKVGIRADLSASKERVQLDPELPNHSRPVRAQAAMVTILESASENSQAGVAGTPPMCSCKRVGGGAEMSGRTVLPPRAPVEWPTRNTRSATDSASQISGALQLRARPRPATPVGRRRGIVRSTCGSAYRPEFPSSR